MVLEIYIEVISVDKKLQQRQDAPTFHGPYLWQFLMDISSTLSEIQALITRIAKLISDI